MILRIAILLLITAVSAHAQGEQDAGQVLFVAGTVTAEREQRVTLNKDDTVYEKDVIVTAERSRGQLLMRDGGRFALRPSTRFLIEEYFLAGDQREQPDGSVVVAANDSAVTQLIKGGFRAITGSIGRENVDDYTVDTPAATMGIRGTHYSVVWCAGDCQLPPGIVSFDPIQDGLYLGVSDGTVHIENLTGEYLIYAGEFVYVRDRRSKPVWLPRRPAVLIDLYPTNDAGRMESARELQLTIAAVTPGAAFPPRSAAPAGKRPAGSEDKEKEKQSDEDDQAGETGGGPPVELPPNDGTNSGFEAEPEVPIEVEDGPITTGRLPVTLPLAISSASISGVAARPFTANSIRGVRAFSMDGLTDFRINDDGYAIGTAMIRDSGFDAVTGIGWGRWAAGAANVTLRDGTLISADLAQQNLHWVYGPAPETGTSLPITGIAAFTLTAGTSPTDSRGNLGILGNATLLANFTNATVQSGLLLVAGGRTWVAGGTGTIDGSLLFSGPYNNVLIGGQAGGGGSFSGFFGNRGVDGFPTGAGLSYELTDPAGVSLFGTAVFGRPTP